MELVERADFESLKRVVGVGIVPIYCNGFCNSDVRVYVLKYPNDEVKVPESNSRLWVKYYTSLVN